MQQRMLYLLGKLQTKWSKSALDTPVRACYDEYTTNGEHMDLSNINSVADLLKANEAAAEEQQTEQEGLSEESSMLFRSGEWICGTASR